MDKQDDKQERVTPKLRFPEFQTTLGWSNKPLSKLANRITSKNKSGEITRVFTNSANDGVVDQSDYFDREIANKDNLNGYYIIELGDYVYNPRISTTAPVGPISKNKIAKGVMSPLYTVFRFHQTDNDFYEHYFKTNCWHKYLQHVSNSGARHDRMNITNDDFMAMPVPTLSHKEQQKIADCLSSIDELINFREQKLAALKQHKKGLMQQLFPSHNDLQASKQAIVYPKLRFPQFKDCKGWEVVRISDLLVEKKRPVKLENETEYCLVTVKRRHGGITLREVAKGKEIKVQSQFRVFTDDFLISKRQIVHCACGVLPKELDGSIVSNEYSVLNAKENVNITFFNYFCHQPIVEKSFLDCSSGIVIEKMLFKLDEWMKQEFYFPKNPKEQQAIADCLSSLDKLINEENEQIGRLKDHKKGLMQQLFPIFRN